MEEVRLRDDNWSPPDSATSFNQADPFLLTPNRREFDVEYPAWSSPSPSTTTFHYSHKSQPPSPHSFRPKLPNLRFEPPRSKPLFRGFERPSFSQIAILAALCLFAYPALYILTLIAKDKSLFVVRLIVAMWCSGVGFSLGYVLLGIAVKHFEAASEFTTVCYRTFLTFDLEQLGPPSFTWVTGVAG